MKNLSHIFDALETSQGLFVGNYKPHGRVTVEPDWQLNLTGQSVGTSNKGPFRWYQRGDGDRTEVEVPNILSIQIDRSLDQDAAGCTIRMANQKMNINGASQELLHQLGRPGYFTPDRGVSAESQARWNHETNEWQDVFTPMALLRTYQGYGGYDAAGLPLPIEECLDEGYLTLTGTWIVDEVTIGTDGYINFKARDAAKLLIEQQLYKPLVPSAEYPLRYYRWVYTKVPTVWDPMPPKTTTTGTTRNNYVPLTYVGSSGADWYGYNPSIHGHRDLDMLDGNPETFALSVGNSHPSRPFCTDYWEFEVNAEINKLYLHPWAGNYELFISVMENGAWVGNGEGPITWDTTSLEATQYVAPDVLAHTRAIPYVMREGVPWEEARIYQLPRTFRAQRIRITFRGHTQSQWGPWYFRAGVRELQGILDESTVTTQTQEQPLYAFGLAAAADKEGYYIMDAYARQWAFGDFREAVHNDPYGLSQYVVATTGHPSGEGMWALETDGTVHSYGEAQWYGSPLTDAAGGGDYIDIAATYTGNGYYVLRRNGTIYAYGDAVHYGHMTPTPEIIADAAFAGDGTSYYATAICTHPSHHGYWVINGLGQIQNFNTTFHGEFAQVSLQHDAWPRGITSTITGEGYWVIFGNGQMGHFGDAADFGDLLLYNANEANEATNFREIWWDVERSPEGNGAWVLRADGLVIGLGDAYSWGSLGSEGEQRSPGNYLDYSDIVRELLLWAGFHLYVFPHPSERPIVHGNIEDTGIYSEEDLDESMFDKKAVIDAIRQLRDIVGYSIWVDEEGAFHFESPNWWAAGNFFEDGTRTTFIPEIDEKLQLTEYTATFSDQALRSEIIISNYLPQDGMDGTITTTIIPQGAQLLRNMCKPAMWVNDAFLRQNEQRIMAELISLQIWFSQRQGNLTMMANPAIQINDQVRIYERVTSESYIHYVRGISSNMDLNTGEYTMQLTTNWLGNEDDWTIQVNGAQQ
jgi:hypothetical protein